MRLNDQTVSIHIPYRTILVVLLTILFAQVMGTIGALLMPLVLAILLAVALMPLVRFLQRRGLRRGFAIGVTTALVAGVVALLLYTLIPTVYEQISAFITNFPEERDKLLNTLAKDSPLRGVLEKAMHENSVKLDTQNFARVLGASNYVLGGLTETAIIFVFTIYLIADGPRMVEWISAFFSSHTKEKITRTCQLSSKIIAAYVLGQLITSALSFVFVFAVLSLLHVPNAILLASISGLFDVLPVLGFAMAVIPAMLFALSVSATTSLVVLGAYLFYHTIENYFIVPMVYGRKLRVSSFVVFFGLLAAWALAGIEGSIAILPILASYPVIEKIWLTKIVRPEAIEDHERELPDLQAEPPGDAVYR